MQPLIRCVEFSSFCFTFSVTFPVLVFIFWLANYHPPGWGVLISGNNVYTYHIYIHIGKYTFKIWKIRPRQGKGTVETSLACASDYVLESN